MGQEHRSATGNDGGRDPGGPSRTDVKTTTAARLAWSLAGLALGLVAATVWLVILNRSVLEIASAPGEGTTITGRIPALQGEGAR